MNLNQLPAVVKRQMLSARVPANYENAKQALAACVRIDECKEWADRAVALAAYARQVKDRSMLEDANRIRLRARLRIGELLTEIPAPHGGWPKKGKGKPGLIPKSRGERKKAGLAAGLNAALISQNVSIARVPAEVRERLIEASPPITPRALADLGRVRNFKIPGRQVSSAYKTIVNDGWGANVGKFAAWSKKHPPAYWAAQLEPDEAVVFD